MKLASSHVAFPPLVLSFLCFHDCRPNGEQALCQSTTPSASPSVKDVFLVWVFSLPPSVFIESISGFNNNFKKLSLYSKRALISVCTLSLVSAGFPPGSPASSISLKTRWWWAPATSLSHTRPPTALTAAEAAMQNKAKLHIYTIHWVLAGWLYILI